jgi:hypothetical protein
VGRRERWRLGRKFQKGRQTHAERGTETSPQARHQPGRAESNASSNTTASSTSRGVCSVQKWREAARGTPADRPTRQCQLLVIEVADDPG